MSLLSIPPSLLLAIPNEGGEHAAGNPAVELLFVFLLLIVFWGAFRIISKKRS